MLGPRASAVASSGLRGDPRTVRSIQNRDNRYTQKRAQKPATRSIRVEKLQFLDTLFQLATMFHHHCNHTLQPTTCTSVHHTIQQDQRRNSHSPFDFSSFVLLWRSMRSFAYVAREKQVCESMRFRISTCDHSMLHSKHICSHADVRLSCTGNGVHDAYFAECMLTCECYMLCVPSTMLSEKFCIDLDSDE